MSENFEFLKSNRFWALVVGALTIYLSSKGWIGKSEVELISTISFAFIGIRTIDRIGEKFALPETK